MWWLVYISTLVASFCGTYMYVTPHFLSTTEVPVAPLEVDVSVDTPEEIPSVELNTQVLFVGDIMLGRAVETRMDIEGQSYPFLGTRELLSSPDITVGNFEGVVSAVHEKAEPMTFSFSIKESSLAYLGTVGFDILSLANNHSDDYGSSSVAYMRTRCELYTIDCRGSAIGLAEHSILVREVNGKKIGFLFLHTLYRDPDLSVLSTLLNTLNATSDIQIAYVHWGDEYKLRHNDTQESLAHTLIDGGVDVVIGHHPHVVQDIELYEGKPIFYSLGNFIFDQFFDDEVTQMIAVRMDIGTTTITYSPIPLTSKNTRSQPHVMSEVESHDLINRIFTNIPVESKSGNQIVVPF